MNAVEAAKQAIASCDGQIEQQKLRVRQARVNVSDKDDALRALTVQSPLTGTVVSLSKNVGDAVSANETLFQVASVEPLNVTIPVDELDIAYARVGQDARIAVDAFPELSWDGKVTKIAFEGTVKDGVTNYGVTVSLDAKEVRLGMSARVTLSVSKMAGALSVPVEAVTWDRGLSYVNKIEGRVPVQTKVRVGIQNDLYAEIISGLEEGDVVLVGSLAGWGGLRLPTNIPGMRMR
jgi:HlyD family secretion protein